MLNIAISPRSLSVAKRHGLIEAGQRRKNSQDTDWLSVAKRHGLIEAGLSAPKPDRIACYPWQNATASLKLCLSNECRRAGPWLSVAKRHGLIEALTHGPRFVKRKLLSVAKRHGLIEADSSMCS